MNNRAPSAVQLATADWFKSSHSGGDGNECIEVANLHPWVAVRDSKNPTGQALTFPSDAWAAFVAEVRSGRLNG